MARPDELRTADAQGMVAGLARDTANIAYTDHAVDQMEERQFTNTHVINTLRRGAIVEGPYISPEDDWRMNFRYVTAGMRLTVTVAIDWPDRLVVVTVY